MPSEPNFQKLKVSRGWPEPGDVFCMLMPDGLYLFGRVVRIAKQSEGMMPDARLVYIYDVRSTDVEPPLKDLVPGRLLIPPVFTNRLAWTKGYWQKVAHIELGAEDLLRQHCFRRFDGVLFDESGNRLGTRSEPCGEWAQVSYRGIDDLVSEALGLPLAPVAPDD